jgi:multidrug efflux pump subunit AcrB
LPISIACLAILLAFGLVRSGIVPFVPFPKLDGKTIIAKIVYPDGTPVAIADAVSRRIEQTIRKISHRIHQEELARSGKSDQPLADPTELRGPVSLTFRQVGQIAGQGPAASFEGNSGSHVAQVLVELLDATERNISSSELIRLWREESGDFSGAERVVFDAENIGPGGAALEFKVLAPRDQQGSLEAAVERCKQQLAKYEGVYDIRDDSSPGKIEFQLRVRENATSLGISNEQLTETVRAAYYGVEVMRLQRGRHEVKLMVRYPREQRRSLADFQEIRVRGLDSVERPITELADVRFVRGYSEINRLDQYRSITVTANLDETKANADQIIQRLKNEFLPTVQDDFQSIRFRWEGQAQETSESIASLRIGFLLAILGIYALLVLEFHSYLQPFIVLAIIPFGVIGAVFGHALMGLPLTLFSMFGLVTLTGVVVNDSIVLLDFTNQLIRQGVSAREALIQAGARRLRPVLLTSVTTVAGLMPILLEKSFQAQLVIPMATSIAFGLVASTVLVLFQVPNLYWYYYLYCWLIGQDLESFVRTDDVAPRPDQAPVGESPEPAQLVPQHRLAE